MANQYIVAIDQGTTGSTVLVIDVSRAGDSTVIGRKTVDFPQHFPQTGWVEHDLEEVWGSVAKAAEGALTQAKATKAAFDPKAVIALGITNQRETLCVFDRKTARPLTRAIVWQCKRSAAICERIRAQGLAPKIGEKTGLVVDPYFSGTKITWIMESLPEVAAKIRAGAAVLGTIDTYLIARLTAAQSFVTEASNASRTLCFDISTGKWDLELLDLLGIPSTDVLPEVKDSAGTFGKTKGLGFLPDGIPIAGVLGDQQAALAGQTCFDPGEAKCTYGTGAFLLMNLGDKKLQSKSGMLTTVAWQLKGKRTFAFEGSAFIAGAAVQFLRDQLLFFPKSPDSEALAAGAKAAPEVYFVPALAGLGAPYWDPKAQGAFFGLTRGTTKGQMIRAVLEGIAFQVADLTRAMERDRSGPLTVLRVDGGAAANNLLMQAQADYSGIPVDRPQNLETTAFGAGLFAGLGVGLYSGLDDLRSVRRTERLFEPARQAADKDLVRAHLQGWSRAVRAVKVFAATE